MQVCKEEGSNEESEAAGGQTIGTLECTLKWYFKAWNRKLLYLQFSIAFKRRKKWSLKMPAGLEQGGRRGETN